QVIDTEGHVGSNIEYLIASGRKLDGLGDDWSHIVDVRESPFLLPVTEDRHGFALQKLIHENPDDVTVAVTDILEFAINVMWTKDDIVQTKHFVRNPQFVFDRKLRDPVGVFRDGNHIFGHRSLPHTIDGNGRSEDETPDLVIDRRIYQVHRANEIVVVIEALDKMAQALGSVGGQM